MLILALGFEMIYKEGMKEGKKGVEDERERKEERLKLLKVRATSSPTHPHAKCSPFLPWTWKMCAIVLPYLCAPVSLPSCISGSPLSLVLLFSKIMRDSDIHTRSRAFLLNSRNRWIEFPTDQVSYQLIFSKIISELCLRIPRSIITETKHMKIFLGLFFFFLRAASVAYGSS